MAMTDVTQRCKSCGSSNRVKLNAEFCLSFPGPKGVKKTPIFSFAKLMVCTDCGLAQSHLSDTDLHLIKEGWEEVTETSR
jgi:hypothetical protein